MAQGITFGMEWTSIWMDGGEEKGIYFLLWGEPGRLCFWGLGVCLGGKKVHGYPSAWGCAVVLVPLLSDR